MPKFKPTKHQTPQEKAVASLVLAVEYEVPDHVKDLIEGDDKFFRIRYDAATPERIERVKKSLIMARRLVRPESIGIENQAVLTMARQYPNRKTVDIVGDFRMMFTEWFGVVDNDAAWIATTWDSPEFSFDPADYDDEDYKVDIPAWRKGMVEIPHPRYDLNNHDERRLKQIVDFLEAAGTEFKEKIIDVMMNQVDEVVRTFQVTDEGGVRS